MVCNAPPGQTDCYSIYQSKDPMQSHITNPKKEKIIMKIY